MEKMKRRRTIKRYQQTDNDNDEVVSTRKKRKAEKPNKKPVAQTANSNPPISPIILKEKVQFPNFPIFFFSENRIHYGNAKATSDVVKFNFTMEESYKAIYNTSIPKGRNMLRMSHQEDLGRHLSRGRKRQAGRTLPGQIPHDDVHQTGFPRGTDGYQEHRGQLFQRRRFRFQPTSSDNKNLHPEFYPRYKQNPANAS